MLLTVEADSNKTNVSSVSSLIRSFYVHPKEAENFTSYATGELNCTMGQALG